jgi:Tfp pilus assembly protein PilV
MHQIYCKGQGLIETLITLLFIGVSIIALTRFQNYLAYSNNVAQQQADATILALKQIETLRNYQVINNTSGYTSYQSIASGAGTSTGINTVYTLTWTITSHTDPTYKTMDVTVAWTDHYNTAQSVSLSSHVASIDPSYSAAIM